MKSEWPDRWLEVSVHAPEASPLRDLIMDSLVGVTGGAVLERADRVIAYIQPTTDPENAISEVRQRLSREIPGAATPNIEWGWLAEEDWLRRWRESLRARRVGERFTVAPTWADIAPNSTDLVIRIEPGMAFGTAEHASTRGALRLLESAVHAGDRVLDVGAGSGILAIAAAKVGAADVLAVESDADAARTARENVDRNRVGEHVRVARGVVNATWVDNRRYQRYDVILANILSGVLVPLLPAFARSLVPAGRLVMGGILRGEAERVRAAAAAADLQTERDDREGEWWTGIFRKPDRS